MPIQTFSLILTTLFVWTAQAETPAIKYPAVASQVSFKAVTELPVKPPDHKIAYGTDPLQHGWLWEPPSGPDHKPLIVLVHGGCWLNAFGADHSYPMATALAAAGHPVWSLEYRRSGDPGGGWPGSLNDIKLALSQLDLVAPFGSQTDAVILMGHSAGGHLALLAASQTPEINYHKIIGLAAITDISRYALGDNSCQLATSQFMSGLPHEQPAAYQDASLVYQQLPPNTVLLQGTTDRIVPVLQAQLPGEHSQVMTGFGHFDWIHPGTDAFRHLLHVLQ